MDLGKFEGGGRFAALLTLIFAAILIAIATLVGEIAKPPLWLQLMIWVPITIWGVIRTVRFGKAGLLALRYAKAQLKD